MEKKDNMITGEIVKNYIKTFSKCNLLENEVNQFVELAVIYQLDPRKREIYATGYTSKSGVRVFSIVTGYEVYIKKAEESGQLDGWKIWTEGEGNQLVAKIEIYRKDWKFPFFHEVYINEYDQRNTMWNTKKKTMLKKVAMSQGFRLAFEGVLGGIPYTADEMPDNNEEKANIEIKKEQDKINDIKIKIAELSKKLTGERLEKYKQWEKKANKTLKDYQNALKHLEG